jgi:hypothetical protein
MGRHATQILASSCTALVLGAGLILATAAPSAAADCSERIDAMKTALELRERKTDAGPVLERGVAIEEDGGTTVYAKTGPATPRENWFGDNPEKAAAVADLKTAIDARERGDSEACVSAIDNAEVHMEES